MTFTLPDGLVTEGSGGLILRIHLQPRASKTEICGIQGNELRVRVTSPPVDDAANRLCIDFFAKSFSLPKAAISIISGHKSRHKRLLVTGISLQVFSDLLLALFTANH